MVCRKEPSFDSNLTQVTIETKSPSCEVDRPAYYFKIIVTKTIFVRETLLGHGKFLTLGLLAFVPIFRGDQIVKDKQPAPLNLR